MTPRSLLSNDNSSNMLIEAMGQKFRKEKVEISYFCFWISKLIWEGSKKRRYLQELIARVSYI